MSQGMVSHMETGYWEVNKQARKWTKGVVDGNGDLEQFEECIIRRRRLGLDVKDVARGIGIPAWVLGKYEQGFHLPKRAAELRLYIVWLQEKEE